LRKRERAKGEGSVSSLCSHKAATRRQGHARRPILVLSRDWWELITGSDYFGISGVNKYLCWNLYRMDRAS